MREVGVRELKVHASRILRRVREKKEEVPITYRGRVVAHVVPAEEYERLKGGRPDFWEAVRAFRERSRVASVDPGKEFAPPRSRSKGRDFNW